jgi:phosphoribosyl 1,2-cyclic phosphate phosphodiesterase
MKFTVLGSGTSHGVPMIACPCEVCHSTDPRNHRNRSCFLVTNDKGESVVVDTPPEFRLIAIKHKVESIEAVLYTHSHADHIFGLDDMRIYNRIKRGSLPLYAEKLALDDILRAYRYCFIQTQIGGGKPELQPIEIVPNMDLKLIGENFRPLRVLHGNLPIVGYKIGQKVAYITDVSHIPEDTMRQLQGLDLLFLDATRKSPHETHFHLEKAIEVTKELAPKQTYFTHLSHDYDHEKANKELPDGIQLAYDGLEVEI